MTLDYAINIQRFNSDKYRDIEMDESTIRSPEPTSKPTIDEQTESQQLCDRLARLLIEPSVSPPNITDTLDSVIHFITPPSPSTPDSWEADRKQRLICDGALLSLFTLFGSGQCLVDEETTLKSLTLLYSLLSASSPTHHPKLYHKLFEVNIFEIIFNAVNRSPYFLYKKIFRYYLDVFCILFWAANQQKPHMSDVLQQPKLFISIGCCIAWFSQNYKFLSESFDHKDLDYFEEMIHLTVTLSEMVTSEVDRHKRCVTRFEAEHWCQLWAITILVDAKFTTFLVHQVALYSRALITSVQVEEVEVEATDLLTQLKADYAFELIGLIEALSWFDKSVSLVPEFADRGRTANPRHTPDSLFPVLSELCQRLPESYLHLLSKVTTITANLACHGTKQLDQLLDRRSAGILHHFRQVLDRPLNTLPKRYHDNYFESVYSAIKWITLSPTTKDVQLPTLFHLCGGGGRASRQLFATLSAAKRMPLWERCLSTLTDPGADTARLVAALAQLTFDCNPVSDQIGQLRLYPPLIDAALGVARVWTTGPRWIHQLPVVHEALFFVARLVHQWYADCEGERSQAVLDAQPTALAILADALEKPDNFGTILGLLEDDRLRPETLWWLFKVIGPLVKSHTSLRTTSDSHTTRRLHIRLVAGLSTLAVRLDSPHWRRCFNVDAEGIETLTTSFWQLAANLFECDRFVTAFGMRPDLSERTRALLLDGPDAAVTTSREGHKKMKLDQPTFASVLVTRLSSADRLSVYPSPEWTVAEALVTGAADDDRGWHSLIDGGLLRLVARLFQTDTVFDQAVIRAALTVVTGLLRKPEQIELLFTDDDYGSILSRLSAYLKDSDDKLNVDRPKLAVFTIASRASSSQLGQLMNHFPMLKQ